MAMPKDLNIWKRDYKWENEKQLIGIKDMQKNSSKNFVTKS